MVETRIYVANLNNWYNSSSEVENLMDCAESQGTVYTLEGYTNAWNSGEISELDSDNTMVCIANIDLSTGQVVKVY